MSEEQKLSEVPSEELAKELGELAPPQQTQMNAPPEEMAATMFYLYLPKFQVLVDKLSNKGLRRLVKALVEVPLNNKEFKHTTEVEKYAFLIGSRLFDAKYVMIFDTYNKNLETLHKAAEGASVSTEEIKETNNEQEK